MNEKSLIEKLREIFQQHEIETGERVESVSMNWNNVIESNSTIEKIGIYIEK